MFWEITAARIVRVPLHRSIYTRVDRLSESGRAIDAVSERGGGGVVLIPESVTGVQIGRIKQRATRREIAVERDECISKDDELAWVLDLMDLD